MAAPNLWAQPELLKDALLKDALLKDGAVGSDYLDVPVGESGDGVAAFFVPVVFSAGTACIVRVGETTTPITSVAVWREVIDLALRHIHCLLYTSPSPRDRQKSRMPSSA